ncbi:hypothetical protein CWM47_36050 [Spirosoma pollinicola]|uniref:Uncharacterized protein n=2 Tax=Spirosoma pollinicola TaxID=2057025 RepID=A0A2K8ZAE0_9BACT|nr:hypothetical protein CWM47_36050 [Spirosoma pollinicola]
MDESQLITELLKGLTKDIEELKTRVGKLPTQTSADYGASLDGLTKAVQALQQQVKQAPAAVDLSAITSRLDRIEQLSRQHPDRKASQYVQVGALASGLMAVLLGIVTWLALSWRSERSAFEVSDWKWRNLRQVDPVYVRKIDSTYAVASQVKDGKDLADFHQWIIQQEQADATREAAHQAAEQAKAMNTQADELEQKASTKRRKKAN